MLKPPYGMSMKTVTIATLRKNMDIRTVNEAAILLGMSSIQFMLCATQMNLQPAGQYYLASHRRETSGIGFVFRPEQILKVMTVVEAIKSFSN